MLLEAVPKAEVPNKLMVLDIMSSDICDGDQEKYDDVGSILKMNTVSLDWFRFSRGVIALRLIFAVLYYKI
jgi:hypothetical protein